MAEAMSTGDILMRVLLTIIVIGIIILFANIYSYINIDTYEAESELFIYRAVHSPNGISYVDGVSGRVYPGIIDISKFENNSIPILQQSIDFGADNHIGARFIVKDFTGQPLASSTYNPITFRRIAEKNIAGPGGVDVKEKQIYALIKKQGTFIPGILEMSVVVERS
jgi:hypothetical protein